MGVRIQGGQTALDHVAVGIQDECDAFKAIRLILRQIVAYQSDYQQLLVCHRACLVQDAGRFRGCLQMWLRMMN